MDNKNHIWPKDITGGINERFKNHIELVVSRKITDYQISQVDGSTTTTSSIFSNEGEHVDGKWAKHVITAFDPDEIDINKFWGECTKHFPYFSIAGGPQDCEVSSPTEVNKSSLWLAHHILGAVQPVHDSFNARRKKGKLLEIGPGWGGFALHFMGNHPQHTWYGLDVNRLFGDDNFKVGDGRTIPDTLPKKFNYVYSINVFQHLSVAQRDSYYQEVYNRLTKGGEFMFGLFAFNDVNRDWVETHWNTRDVDGNTYCHFFNQFTLIEEEEAIHEKLAKIGFQSEVINENNTHYRAFKCIKI